MFKIYLLVVWKNLICRYSRAAVSNNILLNCEHLHKELREKSILNIWVLINIVILKLLIPADLRFLSKFYLQNLITVNWQILNIVKWQKNIKIKNQSN